MSLRRRLARFVACVFLLLAATPGGTLAQGPLPPPGSEPGRPVHLRSRQFVPAPGLEVALERQLRVTARPRVHALVQLHGPLTPSVAGALRRARVELLAYIPEDAWLASIPADAGALRPLLGAGVRALLRIRPDDRLSPYVRDGEIGPWATHADGTYDLVATAFADAGPTAAAAAAERAGAEVIGIHAPGKVIVRASRAAIGILAQEDDIQWVDQVPPPPQEYNDGVRALAQVDAVHTYGPTGEGVTVAMWDSGLVGTHEDLDGRVISGDGATSASDHATHVAGTMAGSGARIGTYTGVAPGVAPILSYDWTDPLAEHVDAAARGAVLSQNSWGYGISPATFCYWGDYIWTAAEYDEIVRGRYGDDALERPITVLFAAGNAQRDAGRCSRTGYNTVTPPATAKNVITVGAIHTDDASMTTFSSWGPTDDGRLKPEVVAGGCQTDGDGGVTSTLPHNLYAAYCGTSMATPAASGAVALLVDACRAANRTDPLPATLKALLVHTARDHGNPGPDYQFGYGAVDAQAAVAQVLSEQILEGSVSAGAIASTTLDVPPGATELRVTLAWADPPAAENAARTLVNNLDLTLRDPSGNAHYPWVLSPGAPAKSATRGVDSTNVVEQVAVEGPAQGTWTLSVSGTGIPGGGEQAYSLVWSVAGGGGEDENAPPTASFTHACDGLTCHLDGSASTDPDGDIVAYAWSFGDGDSDSGALVSHTYPGAGAYTVTLSVTDDDGATDSEATTVSVQAGAPDGVLYVASIDMAGKTAGPNRSATATVTVRDGAGGPVPGATVYGEWSGDYMAEVSGVTDSDGTVSFGSRKVRWPDAVFTFTVTDVVKEGYGYEAGMGTTSAAVTVP